MASKKTAKAIEQPATIQPTQPTILSVTRVGDHMTVTVADIRGMQRDKTYNVLSPVNLAIYNALVALGAASATDDTDADTK